MDFRTFFVKRIMMSFFISTACICAAMALIGMISKPDTRFGYEAFLSPLIFGAVATFPAVVQYSKKDLSKKQMALRNVIHLILIEAIVLSVLHFAEILTNISMTVTLGVSILVIYLTVNLVLWVNDKKTAKEFNAALKKLQNNQ